MAFYPRYRRRSRADDTLDTAALKVISSGDIYDPVQEEAVRRALATQAQQQASRRGRFSGVTYNPGYWLSELGQREIQQDIPEEDLALTGLSRDDVQGLRTATRDVKASVRAFSSGEINVNQLSKVVDSLRREHGEKVLVHLPEWRELVGGEGAYQQAKQAAVNARAAQTNSDPTLWHFNEESGRPEVDTEVMLIRKLQMEQAEIEAKPALELRKTELDLLAKQRAANMEMARTQYTAMLKQGVQPDVALQEFNKLITQVDRQYTDSVRGVSGQPSAPAPAAEQPQALPGVTHPKLPTNVRAVGAFGTVADLQAANAPPGSYAVLAGNLIRRNRATGKWEPVR